MYYFCIHTEKCTCTHSTYRYIPITNTKVKESTGIGLCTHIQIWRWWYCENKIGLYAWGQSTRHRSCKL